MPSPTHNDRLYPKRLIAVPITIGANICPTVSKTKRKAIRGTDTPIEAK